MYYPIPESVTKTQSATVSRPALPCGGFAQSKTFSCTFSIQKSASPRSKKDNFVFKEVIRPTDGRWREIKESGSIKMTEMSIRNESVFYDIGQVTIPFIKWAIDLDSHVAVPPSCKSCNGIAWLDRKAVIVRGTYVEQGDIDYWKSKYPLAPHYNSGTSVLDLDKVEAAKSEALAELYQTYNLGEEIAELRETISGVTKLLKEGVALFIKSRSTINSLLKKGLKKEVPDRWMEFRYGIMPIVYSVHDLLEINQEGKYATVRKTVRSDVEVSPEYSDQSPYFETIGVSELKASITAKARWGSQGLKNFDRININPITTATAVLPWSMVVRWFFNVQSYLDVKVKSLTSLALEQHACVAVREKRELGTYLCIAPGYRNEHVVHLGDSGMCGKGFYGVQSFGTYTDIRPQRVRLSWESMDNYQRYLFKPEDVKLVYNPYINWKRGIDSLILATRPLSKLLRSLK